MAGPLRFRRSHGEWDAPSVRRDLHTPLDRTFGATLSSAWYKPPGGHSARRLEMDNGDRALFVWNEDAYWLGNTRTPETLWRTEKYTFEEVPYPVARWAQRELLAELGMTDPWLAAYEHVAWFFLPVFLSKDGRASSRAFFAEHAAGFPDATPEDALGFYERFLSTGVFDDHRYTMAAKLGTSEHVDRTRMSATMGEFNAAKLLTDAGYAPVPEIQLDSGHALDFQVDDILVEVTRPQPPRRRSINSPIGALKATGDAKTRDQIAIHGNAALFVDCSSFPDDNWARILGERPDVGHEPAVVFRMRPDGTTEGYVKGTLHLDVERVLDQPAT